MLTLKIANKIWKQEYFNSDEVLKTEPAVI